MFALGAVVLALVLAGAAVLIHFESLSLLDRSVGAISSTRRRLLVTMFGLLSAHVLEVCVFAGAYALFSSLDGLGHLNPTTTGDVAIGDAVYYSAMVYTTVGFGDITPVGGFRLVTATEALVGLSLITWSASFTFLQMQKVWR